MTATGQHRDLLAVDVGNSRIKFGWFPGEGDCETAARGGPLAIAPPAVRPPELVHSIPHPVASSEDAVREWLAELPGLEDSAALIASVHPDAAGQVEALLSPMTTVSPRRIDRTAVDIPMDVESPDSVGIDRLLCAAVASRLKRPHTAAIAATVGTAITVNLVSAEGVFRGGAILPGLRVAVDSLHRDAAALPLVESRWSGSLPEPLGRDTRQAIESGVFWGAVGGLRELIGKLSEDLAEPPDLFVTGGDGEALARCLSGACYVPDMVLTGVYHCWAPNR